MKKLAAIAALGFLTAGCGFTPMYGGKMAPQMASIYVEPIPERDGYELRNTLIDLLGSDGRKGGKRYSLAVTLSNSSQGIALQNDATVTRYNSILEARYVLTDLQSGAAVTQGGEKELSAYNVAQSPYATLIAEQDASKRAAQDVAERIRLSLGAWFRRQR